MPRMLLAGLALIGLAACTTPSPKQQSSARQAPPSRATAAATPSHTKPVARAVTNRPTTTATHRTTTTTKQPVHRTTTTRPDTTTHAVNPLINH